MARPVPTLLLSTVLTTLVGLLAWGSAAGAATSDSGRPPLVTAVGTREVIGDPAGLDLAAPLIALAPTDSGDGYWIAAADGGIFAFGDAPFHGSIPQVLAPGTPLAAPIVAFTPTPTGNGYWLTAADGGIFAFGDAPFHGSVAQSDFDTVDTTVVKTVAAPDGRGYRVFTADGTSFAFGEASPLPPLPPDLVDVEITDTGIHTLQADGRVITTDTDGTRTTVARVEVGTGPVDLGMDPEGNPAWVLRNQIGDTVVVWRSGGLTTAIAEAADTAARRAGASSVVFHRGNLDLLSVRRHGSLVDGPPAGWRLPLSAMAVDARQADVLVGGPASAALQAGRVVVGERAAARHRIRPGDVLELVGWDQRVHRLTVGYVARASEVGNVELVLDVPTAAALGFSRPSSVLIWYLDRETLDTELERSLPSVRWLTVDRSWVPTGRDGVLSTSYLKDLVGEPAYLPTGPGDAVTFPAEWIADNIAYVDLPIIGSIRCNVHVADDLVAALAEVESSGLSGVIDVADTRRNGGCFYPRVIRGGTSGGQLSRHSWGIAIDINPRTNPFGGTPTMDPRVVEIFRRHGFAWGGTWVRPDGMHFEWLGPRDAQALSSPEEASG